MSQEASTLQLKCESVLTLGVGQGVQVVFSTGPLGLEKVTVTFAPFCPFTFVVGATYTVSATVGQG
jgi:hypothetical protein